MPWLAWIQRAVLLLVLIGLIIAASKAAQRWREETGELTAQARALRIQAAAQPDAAIAAVLETDAARREAAVPSLANVHWGRIGLASLLYAAGLFPAGWVLHRSLRALSVSCSRRRAIAAQFLGHAGKYIPGKATVVFLRVGAILPKSKHVAVSVVTGSTPDSPRGEHAANSRPPGRPIGRVATCVFFETLVMIGAGGAVSGVLLWQSPLPAWVRLIAAALAFFSLVALCPPLLRRVLGIVAARRQIDSDRSDAITDTAITWSLLAQCWLMSLISWALIGLSFATLITAIPSFNALPPTLELILVATAAISLGMVLGFASLLPGGAGVREYVTLLVLAPSIGQTQGLLAVIAARLMFILVEAILAGLSALYLRHLHYLQPIPEG